MTNRDVLARLFAAYDTRDLDTYLSGYDDDATYVVNSQDPVVGRAALTAQTTAEWNAFPDATFDRTHLVVDGDWTAWRWRMRATHDGDYGPLKATHRTVDAPGATHARIVDGRVAEMLILSDRATMYAQLGLT